MLQTLWPHIPMSSRVTCFDELFANVVANENHISEIYPDRGDMPYDLFAADPLAHVMRRWNKCAWYYLEGLDYRNEEASLFVWQFPLLR